MAPSHLTVSILIYVTAGQRMSEKPADWEDDSVHTGSVAGDTDSNIAKKRTPSLLDFPAVHVMHGRPDLGQLLKDEASVNTGTMSVTG